MVNFNFFVHATLTVQAIKNFFYKTTEEYYSIYYGLQAILFTKVLSCLGPQLKYFFAVYIHYKNIANNAKLNKPRNNVVEAKR